MSRLDAIKDWEARVKAAGYHAHVLALQVGMSDHQVRRHLTRLFGLPSQHWIDQVRIREACRLLIFREPVKSVAFQLGIGKAFALGDAETPSPWVRRGRKLIKDSS
jgi:methylphosphotriester-DNA--protein-cysteine methyltransferase